MTTTLIGSSVMPHVLTQLCNDLMKETQIINRLKGLKEKKRSSTFPKGEVEKLCNFKASKYDVGEHVKTAIGIHVTTALTVHVSVFVPKKGKTVFIPSEAVSADAQSVLQNAAVRDVMYLWLNGYLEKQNAIDANAHANLNFPTLLDNGVYYDMVQCNLRFSDAEISTASEVLALNEKPTKSPTTITKTIKATAPAPAKRSAAEKLFAESDESDSDSDSDSDAEGGGGGGGAANAANTAATAETDDEGGDDDVRRGITDAYHLIRPIAADEYEYPMDVNNDADDADDDVAPPVPVPAKATKVTKVTKVTKDTKDTKDTKEAKEAKEAKAAKKRKLNESNEQQQQQSPQQQQQPAQYDDELLMRRKAIIDSISWDTNADPPREIQTSFGVAYLIQRSDNRHVAVLWFAEQSYSISSFVVFDNITQALMFLEFQSA